MVKFFIFKAYQINLVFIIIIDNRFEILRLLFCIFRIYSFICFRIFNLVDLALKIKL